MKAKNNNSKKPKSTTVAYNYMRRYERAPTAFHREVIAREIKQRLKDRRLNADNVRFLRHIIDYHVRNTHGIPGHRPTVHTMHWPGTKARR